MFSGRAVQAQENIAVTNLYAGRKGVACASCIPSKIEVIPSSSLELGLVLCRTQVAAFITYDFSQSLDGG